MNQYTPIFISLIMLPAMVGSISAQKNSIISDSLAVHADELEIDLDYPVGKILKFNMGDYTINSDYERRGTYSDTKVRLLGLRVVTKNTSTISFTIGGSCVDTAEVYTEARSRDNTYYPNAVLENFFLDEISWSKFESFAAWITFKGDTNTTWTLYVPKRKGKEKMFPIEMLLTDGVQFINVTSVSSDPHFDYSHPLRSLRTLPAMGVEFYENGVPICALQYDCGLPCNSDPGIHQFFDCRAWMRRGLGAKTELALAAAMSTIVLMYNPYVAIKG